MTTFACGDKVTLTHESCDGLACLFREYWYDGQAAKVERPDGTMQVINLAYVRPADAEEAERSKKGSV